MNYQDIGDFILSRNNIFYAIIKDDFSLVFPDNSLLSYLGVDIPQDSSSLENVFPELFGMDEEIQDILNGNNDEITIPLINRKLPDKTIFFDLSVLNNPADRKTALLVVKDTTLIGEDIQKLQQSRNDVDLLQKQINKINEELKESNATKDKFFSIIAHDLRSPISSCISYLDLLNHHKEFSEQQKNNVYLNLNKYLKNTLSLLENLLLWARSQKELLNFEISDFDLYGIALENVEIFQNNLNQKNIQISNNIPEGVIVNVDYEMFNTIVRNILSNAIKFTKSGGKIIIDYSSNDEFHNLIIIDNGIGMEQAKIDNLFKIDKVSSTPGTNGEMGSGLGLTLCHEFIKKHNGNISVESELNVGTKFIISIPKGKSI
ncbi:MAG TPA: HAMP domain-containing sensor histidine kinase [Spirochaetota bacterium]|nr:HAMP domain-containing sensor histidine kinase [Spirochaetota bacterium]